MESKRSHYRIAPREGALTLTLVTESGRVDGRVLDLSIQGAGGQFSTDAFPEIMPGDRVGLEFTNLLLLEPLTAEAVLRTVCEDGDGVRAGFEFTDPRRVLREVPYVLRSYFNRRRHPRLAVEPPVPTALTAPGFSAQGLLAQIGSGGAMVRVASELGERVSKRDRIELRFDLPGVETPFWFLAVVRGIWSDGDGLGLSLRFDRLGTVDFNHQRAAIEALVAEYGEPEAGKVDAGERSA